MKGDTSGARILLVDDIMENIQVAGNILKNQGFHLNIARNGRQALEVVEKTPPDLILLDIMMPEMDGFECCHILKQNPETRDIPIIFLTANTQTEDIVKGFEVGAVDYIFKPFNAPELLSRIHTHLALRFAQLRLEDLSQKVSRYVSPHVFSAIFSGEKSTTIDTVEKPLTVFFSDIVGFTQRAESLGDTEVTRFLNYYFHVMGRIIHKHGGTLDKFIGDAVMVFFGDPQTRGVKEDAIAAVRMAIEMNQATRPLDLQIRIGLNSGPALVGNFGTEQHMNYTVIGQAVNIASRLENKAEPGRILISQATYDLVKDDFWCEERGPIQVKGLENTLMTYWVNG
ncbi:MAG: adenylate/guanylate cyclase domain-containing protein [Verrucomicrobiota bacterium]